MNLAECVVRYHSDGATALIRGGVNIALALLPSHQCLEPLGATLGLCR